MSYDKLKHTYAAAKLLVIFTKKISFESDGKTVYSKNVFQYHQYWWGLLIDERNKEYYRTAIKDTRSEINVFSSP